MNLISDPWIPTPNGVVSLHEAFFCDSVSWGRGDWDSATLQILIGLVQSLIVVDEEFCEEESDWRSLCSQPPPDLRARLQQFEEYFSGRVFEDSSPFKDVPTVEISLLQPESPKGNTINLSKDIGQWWENRETLLTEAEARIALYSDSIWGMGIGAGYLQGPLGGSRMWTFVEPERKCNLWERVCLNVLPRNKWIVEYGEQAFVPDKVFPWLAPLTERIVTPLDLHSLAIYWAIPRRNQLEIVEGHVKSYRRVKGGLKFEGWKHPLCPYRIKESGEQVGVVISPGHIGFGDWAGLATLFDKNVRPSMLVNEHLENRSYDQELRLRCVGWAAKSAEAYAWIERTFPVVVGIEPELVNDLLDTAFDCRKILGSAVSAAMKSAAGNDQISGIVKRVQGELFAKTELEFFRRVQESDDSGWREFLKRTAVDLFDRIVGDFSCRPQYLYKSRSKLLQW